MTSTNDGKDVKSNQTSGPKGKSYYIELYKSLDARLSGDCGLLERTRHLCDAWRQIYSLCQHSAPSTHPHLLSWLQRHTAKTVLQTEWHKSENKDEFHKLLGEAIDEFTKQSRTAASSRDGFSQVWETQLVQRGEWFQRILPNPWGHPTLRVLLDSEAEPPSDHEVLEWLKDERCVMFVTRLRQLAADKHCVDLALLLVSAVMDRVRASEKLNPDAMEDAKDKPNPEVAEPTFANVLKVEAGFTVDVWELLTDIEFVLLHKRDKRARCIELAKQTPLRDGYQLVERLQSRLDTSPREKKLWKNAKDVAIIIAQVIITRCMVVPVCGGAARTALYCCARSLARLLAAPRLRAAAAALAAPAATARHLHTLAAAVDAQSTADMKPFVCELYVRAITAGMNELERLKLKTEKCGEAAARGTAALLAAWLRQLGGVLAASVRVRAECALTAFSLHPAPDMLADIRAAPSLPPIDILEPKQEEAPTEFGSWASDSRSQTNFVKTSETINLKQTQHQANVLSTAILTEGEALGLSPELCQDITVLLSGPRLKTLSWDMDRELLLEKCRMYMERTHGGTRTLTTELKYLNLDPKDFDHLPEEEDDDTDIYYGIEKGYEHLVEQYHEPEEIWQDAEDPERTASAHSSDMESIATPKVRRKKKSKKNLADYDEDLDPLSYVAEAKRTEKKKERPHSKERSKERAKAKTKIPKDPLATDPLADITTTEIKKEGTQVEIKKEGTKEKKKRERKKKEKKIKSEPMSTSLSSLIGMKISQVGNKMDETKVNPLSITDSDYDSQGKSSLNSEGNDPDVVYDGVFSMDELKSPDRNSDKLGLMRNNELHLSNGAVTINSHIKKINNIQHSINNTNNVANYSLPSPNSSPNQSRVPEKLRTVTDDVKKSITRLIQFRRQKALNEQRSLDMSPPINSSPTTPNKDPNIAKIGNAITKPQIPLHTHISPKPVEVPDIPKVYINKKQSEQLAEIKEEMNYLLNIQNSFPRPVIQYAQKPNANIQSPGKILNPTLDISQDGYTVQNKLLQPMSRVKEIKSRKKVSNVDKDTQNQKTFHDFLQELQKSINAGIDESKPENTVIKKEIRPINRVTPVLPVTIKAETKTSPPCAKQIMQQKKMDALNTFSRLSYMHKNSNLKMKQIEAVIEHQDKVINSQLALSNIDQVIQEQKHAKFKYLQTNDLIISRVNKSSSKTNDSQLTQKVEKPIASSTRSVVGEHPLIANLLKRSEVSTQKTPVKYENQASVAPTKYENETKNVKVEPRDSSTPVHNRFSALSEKDQNDLLLLLRQQRKQNATQPRFDNTSNYNIQPPQPSPQCPSASNTQPLKYNSVPCHQPPSKKDTPSHTINLQNTGIKIPHVIRNTVDVDSQQRPVNMVKTELNCTKNADSTPNMERLKTEIISDNVAKIAKTIAANKETEWESVMNALLSHKTPSRGPNALEMALNKETIDKNYAENILRSHRMMTPNTTEHSVKPIIKDQTKIPTPNPNVNTATNSTAYKTTILKRTPKSISKETKIKMVCSKSQSQATNAPKISIKTSQVPMSTANIIRPVKSETPKSQHQSDKRPSQTDYPKRTTSSNKKQFSCILPKEDDPFISGIRNSDYDLLEELMDDDLRQEIGELSDDETFSAPATVPKDPQNFAVVNKDNPAIQHEKRVVTAPVIANRQQTVIKSVQKIKSGDPAKAIDIPVHQTSAFVNTQTKINTADYKVQDNVQATNIVHQVPSNVIVTPNCINNASYMSHQVNQIEPTFVTTMPQQNTLKKVVLLSSEIVYQPCTLQTQIPITNLATNSYVTFNNQPNMALYQTTQFAAPVVSPIIIGNAITMPMSLPIENIQTTSVPKTSEVINNSDIQHQVIEHEINKDQTMEAKSEVSNQVTNKEARQDIGEPNTQSQAEVYKSEKEMFDLNKSCERKVLSEVQEKFGINEKMDMIMTRSRKLSLDPDVKKDASKDQERLKKKRMAILNRKIYHRSNNKPIALTYVPLKPSDNDQEKVNTSTITDSSTNSTEKDLHETNQDKNTMSAPPVDSSENFKENKSDSLQCRRILLRSSNRLSKANISDVAPSDTSTKIKVRLKPNTTESTEEPKEQCSNDNSLEPDQKIVVHKKTNKKKKILTSKAKGRKTEAKANKAKANKVKRNLRVKNQEAHVTHGLTDNKAPVSTEAETLTELPELMDIEEQLTGSKIPKNVSPPESETQVCDKDQAVLDNASKCEVVLNNSSNKQAQTDSNEKDKILQETQESSSKISTKKQDKVDVVSQVTATAKSTDLTEENVKINDSTIITTYSKHRNTRSTEEVFIPEDPNVPRDIGANNALITARRDVVTLNDNEVPKDNVSGTNHSKVDAVNSKHKVSDIKSIPQSYKDSIIIEDMPNAGNDPLKKCVRIKVPSGRIFKATVHSKTNVNFDTLFSDPMIKDLLLSNLTDRKKYMLNVKQVATTTNESDKIKTRVQEAKLQAASSFPEKMETINLLSDDEDEEPCQYFKTEHGNYKVQTLNKDNVTKHQKRFDQKCYVKLKRENLQQYANTDESNFTQQNELPELNSNDSHQNIVTQYEQPSVVTLTPTIVSSSKQNGPQTVTETHTSITKEPDVIEIDDSSNDSLELKSDSNKSIPAEDKLTKLKDLLLKDLGIANTVEDVITVENKKTTTNNLTPDIIKISNEKDLVKPELGINMRAIEKEVKAIEKLTLDSDEISNKNDNGIVNLDEDAISVEKEVTSTEKLTNDYNNIGNKPDFGVVVLNKGVIAVEKAITSALKLTLDASKISDNIVDLTDETISEPTNSLIQTDTCVDQLIPEDPPTESSLPKLELPNCYIKLTKCDDLVKIYEQQRIVNKNCFIKLSRCDRNCEEDTLEGVEIIEDSDEEIIGENILNSTLEGTLSRSGSFSILNNFDEFDDLPPAGDLERSSSPVMNVYEAIAALNNTLTKASQPSELSKKNTCKSEWFKSKSEFHFEYKQTSEECRINTANDDTKANLDEIICSKSVKSFNAPSLLKILSKFFQDNNHIIDQMRPISSVLNVRTPRLKRKSTSFDTSVMSKLSKLVKENNLHDSYDNSMTGKVKHYNSIHDNVCQDDVAKPSMMAQVHMESLTNDVETDLISDSIQEIEARSIETHDEKSVTTVSQTDFVTDELQEVQQDDKNEISSCCAADLISDNLQENEAQSIEPHDEKSVATVSPKDKLQEVQQDDKNETISCCAEDNNIALHRNIPEISQIINDVDCVNIDNLKECDDDMKIVINNITNDCDGYLNNEVQNETPATTDDLALVGNNEITSTIEVDEPVHDCTEVSVVESSLNDNEITHSTSADENSDEQSNQPIENITAMDINQDDLKISEVQIEIPTTNDVEILDDHEAPSATSIDETKLVPMEMAIDKTTSCSKKICDYTSAEECNSEQDSTQETTALNIVQDNVVGDIQIETATTQEDVVLLDENNKHVVTNINKTKLEPIEMAIDKTASHDKEFCDYTTTGEYNSEKDSIKEATAINIHQDYVVGEIQIETATTQEDMVLLDEDDVHVVTNINKTKLETIEMAIEKTASHDKENCDYTTAEECNSEQDSVKETTAINIDQDNVVGEIQIETTQKDMVLQDVDNDGVVTNINETIDESTDFLVKTPNESNGIDNNTPVNEDSDDQNTTQIEHIVEVNVAFDYNQENIQTTKVQTPPTKENMVSLDDNESSLAANIDKTSLEHTEMAIASSDSNIGNNEAANESTSEQNSIQVTHPVDITTEMDINQKNLTIGDYIEVSSSSADDHKTEDFDNEIEDIAEATPQHEMPRENVVGDRIELDAAQDSNHKVMVALTNPNEDTKETSNLIPIPNIRDHEYTASNKSNHLLEPSEDCSDESFDKQFTHMMPTANYNTLDIRDDDDILSDGSENVVVDLYTEEMCCDPDLFWSGIESRSQIVNSGVHEKETPIKTDMQVKIQKENDLNESSESVDILDKSEDDDHISTEDECKQLMSNSSLESSTLIEGIECEDPEIGTYYVFPIVSISKSNECDSDAKDLQEVIRIIDDDSSDEELKLNVPKITYSKEHTKSVINCSPLYEKKNRKSLKRKADMTDTKISEKRYRKGKGIDYPKSTAAAIKETAYTTQFKCLFDYFNSIKFSYSLPFHKDYINVHNVMYDWPIQSFSSNVSQTENEVDEYLFRDVETAAEPTFPNPKVETALAEEIAAEYNENDYSYSDINETNFNMGFGEGSDRVIQNLEGGDDISKFSAATLSDVKQSQPLLLSESSNNTTNTTKDEIEKLQRHNTYMKLRDRVRSFFRKTKIELNYDWIEENKKDRDGYDASTFPFGLNVPELFEPGPVEAVVQVVQVGQLAVSAAAQNPVTCDPRVTQVSNVSPSQCSEENSANDDPQSAIKTEYTELTTADLRLPLVHDYAQHNQSMPMESQEASNMADDNIPIETEIKSVVKIELMEELPEDNPEFNENDEHNFDNNNFENNESQNNMNNIDYSFTNVDTNVENSSDNNTNNIDVVLESAEKQHISDKFPQQKQHNGSSEKTDQIAHAMNAAGITTTSETITDSRAQALVNILSQNIRQSAVNTTASVANTYPKTTSINAMSLQQALAQILPPPLNQTNVNENNQQTQNTSVTPQVLHIVQSKNASGNQITLVDNSQQSVISTPNGTPVLHIVQNKSNSAGPISNGTPTPQTNTFSGLSLVDAGLQQGGNQLLHIVNTGNQKNSAGQLLKRVNLLTNLANVQGSNEQKMVQFVCKSADGKSIQLNAPHQRSMVLRLQPIETPNIQAAPTKPVDSQDISPTPNAANTVPNKETLTPQEIKSRSVYEENYAKFIQNSNTNKTTILEKATSLPKFNQAFGKQVFQDGNQKQNEINSNSLLSSVNNNNDTSECQSTDNAINLEHITQLSSPPLLLRKSPAQTSQAQNNLVQQIKQTIAPMNLQTMHGGVIYTRQIPVNIGGGQTINLITVPSTELIDDSTQKQQADVKFVNQGEIEPSIIKIVPQSAPNTEVSNEDNNTHMGANENSHAPQPQPVLAQMRIKLPMLSKAPQMVSGARVVRPSFFQIQRNVIGGTNQQVYQQLVLTAAPPLGQQTIRLPQTQTTRQVKVPTENQSSTESQMSSSTLEQLREFDLVLEQVKERSTVQPNANSSSSAFSKLHTPSTDTTDGAAAASSTSGEITQQVLYSIGNNQPINVAYVNRKATISAPTTSSFVRSPDSSGTADSSSSTLIQIPRTVTSDTSSSDTPAQSKPTKVSSKSKSRQRASSSNPPNTLKLNTTPPKTTAQKPLEDELTMQRILYILADYKEQVENSPDKDKPAPRRRSNPPSNPSGSSKRKKSSSSSRRPGVRDISPIHGEDTCRTMGSEDSSCGTSGDCNESCLDSHSPQDSPRKVVRKITFDHEIPVSQPRPQPQRNLIVADGQTITVARGTAGKPATAVLMPANYILPVSMVKGGQQIAIVTNRGPKLLTVGGEGGTANALLLQRLIGPAGLKPVLARPGVRHVRLPTAALHNLQAFNLAATVQPPDSTASPVQAPTPPELVDTRANSSPWTDRPDAKPDRGSSPEGSEPWNLPSSADTHDYTYEETARTDNMDRTVLDSISDRYSPDMEAQRIFDKMFDVDSKKSYMVDSPRCGYDIDASDCDDKAYHQVVHKKDGTSHRQHRLTHVSAAALRHKYAILEHELRLQKSLSEECEDLGVDSPSASELFPEAELLFAASPAHDHTQDHGHHSHTPQPTFLNQSGIPQPDMDDQIATDQLLSRDHVRDVRDDRDVRDHRDLNLGLEDVGIVTVSEDGLQATIALDQEEFARAHPNTTFHSEPTDDAEVHPFTISGIKGRHITSTIFHSNRPPGTVLMTAPQTTVISQATTDSNVHNVKYDIDNMINSLPSSHTNTINLSSVLVKDDGLTRFDNLLNDTRELHLSNTASAIVHSAGNATQVIRRVCYDDDKRDTRFLMDEPEGLIAGDDAKMIAEDSSRDATLESMADVDDDRSSPERHTELFWESNSASERSESRRPLDFSSDSDKCCKSPFDETNSTDSSGVGTHMRLDTVIKEARGIERSDGSSADDTHPPLRTYPPKRLYHTIENDIERSTSGKTRAGERSPGLEVRRRASGRGVVKRGCHCCSGEPAPPRPKKPRQRKPTLDFTTHN